MIFTQLSLEAPLSVIASPFLLSLRAERGNLSEVPDCFVVRQLTDFLAMTEGGHCEPLYLSLRVFSIVIASGAWQSQRGTGLLSLSRAEALSDVKSQARNLAWRLLRHPSLRVGFLAMTEGDTITSVAN